jgi:hypothetical protein
MSRTNIACARCAGLSIVKLWSILAIVEVWQKHAAVKS